MISKSQIKYVNSLNSKKGREEEGCFIAEGMKVVEEFLTGGFVAKEIYGVKAIEFKVKGLSVSQTDLKFHVISESELKKISALTTPNQVLAVFKMPEQELNVDLLKSKLSLVLDTIQDPGNMGTIIRIADWYGIENIICSPDTVDCFNPKVVQATMGSLARVKVHYTDIIKLIESVKDVPVYGAILGGDNIYKSELSENGFIVMGNESKGISEKILKHITHKISIPSFSNQKNNATGKTGAESLNVAVATAIICSEFRR